MHCFRHIWKCAEHWHPGGVASNNYPIINASVQDWSHLARDLPPKKSLRPRGAFELLCGTGLGLRQAVNLKSDLAPWKEMMRAILIQCWLECPAIPSYSIAVRQASDLKARGSTQALTPIQRSKVLHELAVDLKPKGWNSSSEAIAKHCREVHSSWTDKSWHGNRCITALKITHTKKL